MLYLILTVNRNVNVDLANLAVVNINQVVYLTNNKLAFIVNSNELLYLA